MVVFSAALAGGCSIGGDPALVPSKWCEVSESTAKSRGMQPGEIFRANDGCSPSEREVCGDFVDGTVFRESACPSS
jgi:hypothetical protein